MFPVEPELEFLSIGPAEVQELKDSMVITLRFRDGDGDIRNQDSVQEDFANLEVVDLRPTLVDSVAKIFYKFPEYTTNTCNPSILSRYYRNRCFSYTGFSPEPEYPENGLFLSGCATRKGQLVQCG
ncbi:MAG: hypothetical protein R3B47_15790 [Bacteroidia bacterium]